MDVSVDRHVNQQKNENQPICTHHEKSQLQFNLRTAMTINDPRKMIP